MERAKSDFKSKKWWICVKKFCTWNFESWKNFNKYSFKVIRAINVCQIGVDTL